MPSGPQNAEVCNQSLHSRRTVAHKVRHALRCDCERFAASQLLESKGDWNTKQAQEGVYFHGPKTSQRAQNYMVFEHVFSDGAWWGATLELIVHHAQGKSARDQWVQLGDSVEIQALWLGGISIQSQKRADTVPLAASLTSRCA